jgi:type VI secretion system protein
VLRLAGATFRVMTEGLREVLMSRAAIKNEMKIEQTTIRPRDNNPLKFSVTVDDALVALLSERPGYMPPVSAASEALADVKSHEIAVMVGVQTALLALLKRFDPDALEARLSQGRLGSVLPAARKARYWEAFRQMFDEIKRESEDDFQAAFGQAFTRAYIAQTRKK